MSIKDEEMPRHRILRDVFRHYLEFQQLVALPEHDGMGGYGNSDGVLTYGYYVKEEDGSLRKVMITLSFWDLQGSLKELSPRKREAVFYNVILDMKQKDVAEIMGITTVSVGQYVDQGMIQMADKHFLDEDTKAAEEKA